MMKKLLENFKLVFPYTIPVLAGYLILGMAYGFLMQANGFGLLVTGLSSVLIFAGSLQYLEISLLTLPFNPLNTLMMSLMINARHIFYGISLLDKYRNIKKSKPFLIFGLTDETFALVLESEKPSQISEETFYTTMTALNYSYWIMAGIIGNLLGELVNINVAGMDFVLTALFVSIFTEQWIANKDHRPALLGIVLPTICLIIFKANNFMIPSMLLILVALLVMKKFDGDKV